MYRIEWRRRDWLAGHWDAGVSRYCCRCAAEEQVRKWRVEFPDNDYVILEVT